jgi:hypothetical protein
MTTAPATADDDARVLPASLRRFLMSPGGVAAVVCLVVGATCLVLVVAGVGPDWLWMVAVACGVAPAVAGARTPRPGR